MYPSFLSFKFNCLPNSDSIEARIRAEGKIDELDLSYVADDIAFQRKPIIDDAFLFRIKDKLEGLEALALKASLVTSKVLFLHAQQLTTLEIAYCPRFEREAIAQLAMRLRRLTVLDLSGLDQIDDALLPTLYPLRLEVLGLKCCRFITGKNFEGFAHLRRLDLSQNPQLRDENFSIYTGQFLYLEALDISHCPQLTLEGLPTNTNLPLLRELKADHAVSVTERGIKKLQELPSLVNLSLRYVPNVDAAFAELGKIATLIELTLAGVSVTVTDASSLFQAPRLVTLNVECSSVDPDVYLLAQKRRLTFNASYC